MTAALKGLPAAKSAEDSAIGAALIKPSVLAWLDLEPEDFSDGANRMLWEAMQAVFDEHGTCDPVLLEAELSRRNRLQTVGGLKRLGDLADFVPTAQNVEFYAEEVRIKRTARDAARLAGEISSMVTSGREGEALLDEIQRLTSRVCTRRAGAEALSLFDAAKKELAALSTDVEEGKTPGAPTGLRVVDERIGGIPPAVLSVLGARPSIGKSAVALNIAEASVRAGWLALIYTFEDSVAGFAQRALAKHSDVEVNRIRGREVDGAADMRKLYGALDTLRKFDGCRLVRAHGMTVEQVIRSARVERQRRKAKKLLVVVDYLQLVPASFQGMRKHERVAHTAEKLSEFAGEDECAVLALSQLNRESERENRAPRLSDIRDSGEIEQVGKLILALHDPGKGDELSVFCLKNHQGPRGEFVVNFNRRICRVW